MRLLIGGCVLVASLSPAWAGEERQGLTLLHTSDLHGAVLPFDDLRNKPADGSLAQVATAVREIRSALDHPVLLLDSGDTIQGTPLEQFTHVRWSEPSPTIAAMNAIGYDAMAVGNHEFNFGLDVLRRAQRQADFPFLSANTVDAATGEPAFPGRMVIQAGALRIGVIGVVTPKIPEWERPEHIAGLVFRRMEAALGEQVEALRHGDGCDLVIVLAHTGFEVESDDAGATYDEENLAERLARTPGVDVLLAGHTHTQVAPRSLDGTIVAQPGARARSLTRIDLELERGESGWIVAAWQGSQVPLIDVEPDAELVGSLSEQHQRVVAALDGPIGEVSGQVSVAGCRLRDCAALDLIHRVQLETSGAELSLAALLSDRTPDLAAGPVTWRWVHAFYVYPNTLVKVVVSGAEVVEILEHSARYYRGFECDGDVGCTVLTDPEIPHYNVDTMAGLSYRIDPTRPEGDRVVEVRFDGRPIDPVRDFTLVCNNYRAAGGGGFPHLAGATRVWQSAEEMSDLIGDYIGAVGSWSPEVDGNWWLGPPLLGERPATRLE